jgi:hypothetical protein
MTSSILTKFANNARRTVAELASYLEHATSALLYHRHRAVHEGSNREIKLVSAWNKGNVGDQNQSLGIGDAVADTFIASPKFKNCTVSRESVEIDSSIESGRELRRTLEENWLTKLREGIYEKVVFIVSGSGNKLASVLEDLPREDGFVSIYSGHQLVSDLRESTNLPTITALPKAVVSASDQRRLAGRTDLLLLSGVPHRVTEKKMQETVRQYEEAGYRPIPALDKNTVAVILGGDAPDESGKCNTDRACPSAIPG